jgi:hypothetical protein
MAYHSLYGEVEALNTPTIRRLTPSRCYQLPRITLHFAELKDPVKDKLKRFGLFAIFGEDKIFPTIGAAVALYLKTHDVRWVDREDQTQ